MHLVTGSSGYVGDVILRNLNKRNEKILAIDINPNEFEDKRNITFIQQDICDFKKIEQIFKEQPNIRCIYHCAAQINFRANNAKYFKETNIKATELLIKLAIRYKVKNFIFISSNCVYGKIDGTNIDEDCQPKPFEKYGITKLESEKILLKYKNKINIIIFRAPSIIGEGRLGILSTVFDFIKDNSKLFLVGSGNNKYQFLYGDDLFEACFLASKYNKSGIFNIGSDKPVSLKETFIYLIDKAQSKSKIICLPSWLLIPLMKFFYTIGLSPLGPYQSNMITNTYWSNTNLIKKELGWQPKKNNNEILYSAYKYYIDNYEYLHNAKNLGGENNSIGKKGIIKILKWFS